MTHTFSRPIVVMSMAIALAVPIAGTAASGQTLDRRASAPATATGSTNEVVPANAVVPAVSSESKDVAGRRRNGRIAFDAEPKHAGHASEVVTIRPNGDGRKRLTHNKGPDGGAGWSPYGLRLAFSSGRTGVCCEIFTMRHNGGGMRQITHTGLISVAPDWSPNGRRIVYTAIVGTDLELFTIRRDGTHPKRLTHNGYNDYFPDWSPTGSRIAYAASVKPGLDLEIFTIRPNGTDRQQVTHNKTSDGIPAYSPSGRRLAIEGKNGIYVRRVAGGGLIQVTHSTAGIFGHSWSPNGKRITYAQDTGPDYEIFTIKINGTKRRQVTHDSLNEFHPDWGVRRFQ